MIHTGLFGGSFNPIHRGHTRLAQALVDCGFFDDVWLSISPCNPLKTGHNLAPDGHRAAMLELALEGMEHLHPCFVELDMPRPSYTVDTLDLLRHQHPERKFSLIIGADNWLIFNKWKEWRRIIDEYGLIIYPRPGYELTQPMPPGVTYASNLPTAAISSTDIRSGINNCNQWLDPKVIDYINANKLYDRTS